MLYVVHEARAVPKAILVPRGSHGAHGTALQDVGKAQQTEHSARHPAAELTSMGFSLTLIPAQETERARSRGARARRFPATAPLFP